MKRLLLYMGVMFCLLTGCSKNVPDDDNEGSLKLQLNHVAGNTPLALNTAYTNSFGEAFTITKYKYYLSNITLTDERDLKHFVPDQYFLIDESKPASKTLIVRAPIGKYKAISFLIGVDSLRNVSGAQTGVLDPFHDMFWTWNTGYVMAKLEGTSPVSALPNQKIEYHTGGFKGPQSVLRVINLPLGQLYEVKKLGGLQINIDADVLKWFNGVHNLTIASAPTATAPGTLASQFADNYARMFTITSIQQR